MEENNIDSETLSSFLKRFYDSVIIEKTTLQETNKTNYIGRITLHISNSCNLKCSYCYANGGNYEIEDKLMSKKTAIDFVNFCSNQFDNIDNIVFFGGEPLLNIDVIETIVKEFKVHKENGEIEEVPTFGMITNGTILNEHILRILKNYISFITVSIDGEKSINDANRKYSNGEGSFDKIANFIWKIKKETNIFIKYEATYTKEHLKYKINKKDIADYFLNEFGINGTIVNDINIQNEKSILENDRSNIANLINDSAYLDTSLINVLNALVQNIYREMCPVGSNIVSVSVDGNIYPCHMNTGKNNLSLGSIYGSNIFNNPRLFKKKFPYLNMLKKENVPCEACWIQRLCGGCTILWYYNIREERYNDIPNNTLCEKNKKYFEELILAIMEIKSDKEKWTKLLERLEKEKIDSYL